MKNINLILIILLGLIFFKCSVMNDNIIVDGCGKPNDFCEVKIGNQVWMCKNLDVDRYRNGDLIPEVTDPTAWENLKTGAWCYYDNDPSMGAIYGKLYNWYAVNDPRGLAPSGWHVPSDDEWKKLEMSLGMSQSVANTDGWRGTDEGGKLKEKGTLHWLSPNVGGTNESGFTALPGGLRDDGTFDHLLNCGHWWVSTDNNATNAYHRNIYYESSNIARYYYYPDHFKNLGFSVRCVQD
jgi:uncharacterized protein (TIGR02145 family)